jgi:cell division protein FtsI/penicillin-binding protein 2
MIALLLFVAVTRVPKVEIAEIDLTTGATIKEGWRMPAPPGSLIKPFTAIAYAARHDYRYPQLECAPGTCWLPAGHGRIGIREAVAHSCNSYFAQLAREVGVEDLNAILRRFSLPTMAQPDQGAFIGLGDTWRVKPQELLRAYGEIASRAAEPGVAELLEGMALSAKSGTGKAAGEGWLVKTGTAPCVHAHPMPGDGYALGLYPASHPRRAILVRAHGATGAEAAAFLR